MSSVTFTTEQIQLANANIIAPWFLYDAQKDIYQHLHKHRFPVVECSRRFGKTTTDLVFVEEYLRLNPGHVWRWCEPLKNQAREIVMPEMDKIQRMYNSERRAKYVTTDSFYLYPNGSRLYLRGVNEDKGESARGSFAHGITADELGSWRDPSYILNEVLLPQLATTKGRLHKLSTPPKDLAHAWYRYKGEAIAEGCFIQKKFDECVWIDDEEKEILIKEIGGRESTAFKREFMCEPVADVEALVIPEFREAVHVYKDMERPKHFDWYIGADFGFKDYTAVLYGYVDFMNRTLVIEDEILVRGKSSSDVAGLIKQKELEFKNPPYRRIADITPQQCYDLQNLHGLQILPTMKDDKYAAINAVRVMFSEGRIVISEKCVNLIQQLKVGIWNERHTDFERGESIGHLDAIMALVYLNRNIDWHRNPFPAIEDGIYREYHYIPESARDTQEKKLANVFTPFKKGR